MLFTDAVLQLFPSSPRPSLRQVESASVRSCPACIYCVLHPNNRSACRVFRFSSLPQPLEVPAGSSVHLYCAGRAVNFFHPAGHVSLGVDAKLELDHCNVTTLYRDDAVSSTSSSSFASFFVGSGSAQVVFINSAARQFYDVRPTYRYHAYSYEDAYTIVQMAGAYFTCVRLL